MKILSETICVIYMSEENIEEIEEARIEAVETQQEKIDKKKVKLLKYLYNLEGIAMSEGYDASAVGWDMDVNKAISKISNPAEREIAILEADFR